ncbi:hypothetical protein [Actinoplanes sp. GCM10030250]|uniref:hypothetical protein n=1 Tax=Actinoplanes sp. GCM10030250 TaxID=3273376 RepID=UPI0036208B6A
MTDDDLRARLRHADPAASLPPVSPDRAAHLTELSMTTTDPRTTNPTRRLVPALAAVALLLIVAGLGWVLARPAPQPAMTPAIGTLSSTPAASAAPAIDLAGPGNTQGKCREPQAERLAADTDFVFAGTVTGVAGGTVSLAVTRVYQGAPAGIVRVTQEGESSEMMLGSGRFETGKDYLVASAGGAVMICGYSGEADSPGLRELYEAAF